MIIKVKEIVEKEMNIVIPSYEIPELPKVSPNFDPTLKTIEEKFNGFKNWVIAQIEAL